MKILKHSVGLSPHTIKYSEYFKQKIKNRSVPKGYIQLSLDVVSLFTNIDSALVIRLVSLNWKKIKNNSKTKITKKQFMEALNLVLNNCQFIFNHKIYNQRFGSPMGSPISPVIADFVMEYIEEFVLKNLDFDILFYFRFVDDSAACLHTDNVDKFLDAFNNANNYLKFTLELEVNKSLSFLDMKIIRTDEGEIKTDWYHKDTWSQRYLSFKSYLPVTYKRNTVSILARKIFYCQTQSFILKI